MGEKHRCSKSIFSEAWSSHEGWLHQCSRNGKIERDGKWYCGHHDPVAIAARRKARSDKWDAAWDKKRQGFKVEEARAKIADAVLAEYDIDTRLPTSIESAVREYFVLKAEYDG